MNPELSVVIPAYNEEKMIHATAKRLHSFLSFHYKNFEIIIGNDGSKDKTPEIAANLSRKFKNIRMVSNEINQGRGSILTKAFKESRGEYISYVDADLAIKIELLPKLIDCLKNGCDAATGSKHLKDSKVEYGKLRRVLSNFYSLLSRIILSCPIKDYQCGRTAFRKKSFMRMLPRIRKKGWAWDTEVLALSFYNKLKIAELPAEVVDVPGRKSKVVVLRDAYLMFLSLLRIRKHRKKFR